jgi:hypothetical protein
MRHQIKDRMIRPRELRTKPRTRCGFTDKVCFPSERSALERAGEILDGQHNRRATNRASNFRAYRCEYCSQFHLTSHA